MKRIKSLVADAALYSGHYLGQVSGFLKGVGVELHIKFKTEKGNEALAIKKTLDRLTNEYQNMKGKSDGSKVTVIKASTPTKTNS